MANVSQNLRNRLHKNIQDYTRSKVKDGRANSKNFIKTINDIINVVHFGKTPLRRNNLPPKPRVNNNRPKNNTQNGWNALPGSNSMKNNTFHNAKSNQPWLKNMAQMRGEALMKNERLAAQNL